MPQFFKKIEKPQNSGIRIQIFLTPGRGSELDNIWPFPMFLLLPINKNMGTDMTGVGAEE